jgi:hypothetical protein
LILGHENFQLIPDKYVEGKPIIVNNGDRGRFDTFMKFQLNKQNNISSFQNYSIPLSDEISQDTDMLIMIKQYKKDITNLSYKLTPSINNSYNNLYSTSTSCSKCHINEYNQWKNTKHAHGFDSLKKENNEKREECLVCHALKYEYSYVSSQNQYMNVQCENCHGPGKTHIITSSMKANTILKPTKNTCLSCHNKDHDPNFDYQIKLPRILHKT